MASEPTDAVEGRGRLVQKRKLNERGGKACRPTLHIPLTPPQNRRNNDMLLFHEFSPSESDNMIRGFTDLNKYLSENLFSG